jgi:hypothetical protein
VSSAELLHTFRAPCTTTLQCWLTAVVGYPCNGRAALHRVPGNGRLISFRLLDVWEFRDGLISRENVWMDDGPSSPNSLRPTS